MVETANGEMTIRAERPSDRDAIAQVVSAAFKSAGEVVLVDTVRESPGFVPELSLVAEIDGRIVGHVMVSHITLADATTEHRIACLAPLAVDPSMHGRGIGSALVRAVVARADEMGEPLIVLQGDPNYYGRFGFEHSVLHAIHMHLPEWSPAEAAQVIRLSSYDTSIRGRVVFPPSFDVVID